MLFRSHFENLEVNLSIGVGGLFDIWAGEISEAPKCIRSHGFEWLYRLLQEPDRLFKRYTLVNIQFMYLILKQLI